MAQVKFLFDAEKDTYNIWNKSNMPITFGVNFKEKIGASLVKICENKKFEDCKKEIIKYNQKLYSSGLIEIYIKGIQTAWQNIEKEYFKRLEKITGKKFVHKIKCYTTTINTCPYNFEKNWFMTSLYFPLPNSLSTCGHEIMHLHFHRYYFKEIEKQIGKEKTHELKEALTVLLNLEFMDLWFSRDKGYEDHSELRNHLKETWMKNKDFDLLIKEGIKFLKR
jgi:hypothetical protein